MMVLVPCTLVCGFTWLIDRKRTAHFIVVDEVSVPAEKKSKMMLRVQVEIGCKQRERNTVW